MSNKPESQEDASLSEIFKDVKDAIGLDDSLVKDESGSQDRAKSHVQKISAQDSTFPTEMNCSQVFDQLLKCYSLGGQIRNYYRYGEVSFCYDKRAKLKFCLGTKLLGEDEQKEKIRHWYMEQYAEQKANKQSSEMVWKSREVPLRLPFREDSEKYLNDSNN